MVGKISNPTDRYVVCLIIDMINRSEIEYVAAKSTPLPPIPDRQDLPVPAWVQFRNRLKIKCEIDHLKPLKSPTSGQYKFVFSNRVGDEQIHDFFTLHAMFDDAAPDPFVKLRLERESTSRGPLTI